MKRISSALSKRGFAYIACLVFVCLGVAAHAELPPKDIGHLAYRGTKVFSGSGSATATAVAADAAGDVYLTGYFSGTFDFDPGEGVDPQSSANGLSSFVSRINADGSYGWTRVFNFPLGPLAPRQRVVADRLGNVYLAGSFSGEVDVDPGSAVELVRSAGRFDAALIKLSEGGDLVWARTMGGPWSDDIRDLTIDPSGRSVYVAGSFERAAQFDSVQQSDSKFARGRADAFITKLGADGSYGWTRTLGGYDQNEGLAVAADDENAYLAGSFALDAGLERDLEWEGWQAPHHALLRKFSASGDELWKRSITGSAEGSITAMTINPDKGELFLLGALSERTQFHSGPAMDVHTAAGLNDVFITRIDTDGSYAWTHTLRLGLFANVRDITANAEALYIAGALHGDVDFDPGSGEDIRSSSNTLASDIFLLSLQDDGSYGGVDIFTWRGGTRSIGNGMAVSDAQGTVYVAGHFAGTMDFDPTPAVDEQSSPDKQYSIYLAKLAADVIPPAITLEVPPDGYITSTAAQTLIGSVSESASLTVNGVPAPITSDLTFSAPLILQEGDNTVRLAATDAAGNTGQLTIHLTLDTQAPEAVEFSHLTLSDSADGGVIVSGAAGSVEAGAGVYITNSRTGELVIVNADSVGSFSAFIGAQPGDILSIHLQDAAGNSSSSSEIGVPSSGLSLPPDPATVAPPVDPTVATTVFAATQFLYSGRTPIQSGVEPGTIEVKRAAVLRGKVLGRSDKPLSGVDITIHRHPEFGQTLSRADGVFDLAVNGGGYLTVDYRKEGYLPVQRQVYVPWQDYVWLPDVVMIALDNQVTAIAAGSSSIQVAQGGVVTDDDGTRRATVLFPAGTQAAMILQGGSTQALSTFHVRATEYTVGANGPNAMPAELPATSGYTYAVELSVDEAFEAGATAVNFNQPVPVYVENFLDFPVGSPVPAGYYDRYNGVWIPSANGRVIEVIGITGGLADLDVSGNGNAASPSDLAALGITDSERARLAALYGPGVTLWRVRITHFSPWDFNWPFGPPPDAVPPKQPPPTVQDDKQDDPDCQRGSIIECQNQILGERIPIVGTPFSLNYRSDRVPGFTGDRTVVIPLTGATVPASLKRVDLIIHVAGRVFKRGFGVSLNQSYTFVWDGKDGYGREVQGAQSATADIGYVYDGSYFDARPGPDYDKTFGHFSYYGIPVSGDRTRQEVTLWQRTMSPLSGSGIGATDQRPLGLGGWSLSIHHRYDPGANMLWLGDGSRRSARAIGSSIITTVAGTGVSVSYGGDAAPAIAAQLQPDDIAVAQDGSILIADGYNHRIRRIDPDGFITTVAGTGFVDIRGFSGDGGPAVAAQLNTPLGVGVAPDGSVVIADTGNNRIRRIGPDGIIATVAGTGVPGFSGDGGPAVAAQLDFPWGIAVAPDGSVLISDLGNNRVRRIGPDGVITTVAGTGAYGYNGDGQPAVAAQLNSPGKIGIAPDGGVLFTEYGGDRVRRVGPDGIITTVAGGHLSSGFPGGDGGPAVDAILDDPRGIAVASDGRTLITDTNSIRHIGLDGIIITVAGMGRNIGFSGDGGPAVAAQLGSLSSVAVAPDGSVLIADTGNNRIRRIGPPFPEVGEVTHIVASEDGAQVYVFDPSGRHLRTLNSFTGTTEYEFAYDTAGRISTVIDGDGDVTAIERDTNGNPTAIVAPDGQRTTLGLDADGYLNGLTNGAGEAYHANYTSDGLMLGFTDPRNHASHMAYNSSGRLIHDEDASAGSWDLSRTLRENLVEMSSALGRTTTYRVEQLSTGDRRRTTTAPDGAVKTTTFKTDGTVIRTEEDGTVSPSSRAPTHVLACRRPYRRQPP